MAEGDCGAGLEWAFGAGLVLAAGGFQVLTTGEKTEYTWNHRHQLTKIVEKDDLGNVTKIVEYAYDPLGRRISKHIDNNGDGDTTDAGDDVDLFFYDGQHIALKTDESGNAENRTLHGPAIDMILADEDATGEVLWAATDHLGSVTHLLDFDGTSDTDVVATFTYDAFGNIVDETGTGVAFIFAYTGRERDFESDLQYNRFRYYDADIGRWLSQDPISFAAGDENLYRYVGNGPTSKTDPSGLAETWSDWLWGWVSPVTPTEAVETYYAYGNAEDAGRLNRREQAREMAGHNLESYLDKRLKDPKGIGGNHVRSGLNDVATVARTSYQVNVGAMAAAAGSHRLSQSTVGGVSRQTGCKILGKKTDYLDDITPGQTLVASSKPSQRVPLDHVYVNPGHHVPREHWKGKAAYKAGKEVLPHNHVELFENSVPIKGADGEVTRWAREGSGKNARYHRFSEHNPNEFHWTGSSSGGVDQNGTPRNIKPAGVPKREIDQAIDVGLPAPKSWWCLW